MSRPDDPDDPDDRDDLDPAPVPAPDAEPTAAERARARAFAELVDKVVAGRPPAAMATDDRALVEVATVIRAATGRVELPAARRAAIVEDALRRAIEGPAAATDPGRPAPGPGPGGDRGGGGHGGDVVPLAPRRWRARAPWLVAAGSTLVAAAAVLLLLVRPDAPGRAAPSAGDRAAADALPLELRSRPADPLVGPIPRERAGDAVSRIDAIFADRLDGYRARTLAGAREVGR